MARCGAMLMAMLLALGPVGAWARGHGSGHSSGSRSSYSSGSHSYRSTRSTSKGSSHATHRGSGTLHRPSSGSHHSSAHTSTRSTWSSHSSHRGTASHLTVTRSTTRTRSYATKSHSTSTRTTHGKTKRDPEQRRAYMKSHPCPSTGKASGACPGYQVDHRVALACGGSDSPSNMEWLTVAEHKAKHKHGAGCRTR